MHDVIIMLKRRFISSLVITLLAVLISACSSTTKLEITPPLDNTPVEFDVLSSIEKLNETRRRFFLSDFKQDPRLMEAARRHAELMSKTGKFGHEFGPATKFKKRIFAVGFQNNAGENLGVGYKSIEEAIQGWLESPGHRKILLKRKYNLAGIAYAPNISGKNPRLNHFWVLILGEG